jgi:hypothetical protein
LIAARECLNDREKNDAKSEEDRERRPDRGVLMESREAQDDLNQGRRDDRGDRRADEEDRQASASEAEERGDEEGDADAGKRRVAEGVGEKRTLAKEGERPRQSAGDAKERRADHDERRVMAAAEEQGVDKRLEVLAHGRRGPPAAARATAWLAASRSVSRPP